MKKYLKFTDWLLLATIFLSVISSVQPLTLNTLALDVQSGVVFNEICSSNKGNNGNLIDQKNSDGTYCDWIELYNPTDNSINLDGYGISDKQSSPFKATLNNIILNSRDYIIIYCSKTYSGSEEKVHIPVNISSDGEMLFLTSPDLSYSISVDIPALQSDYTYGKYPDGTGDFRILSPTAGATNNNSSFVEIKEPVFSKQSGIYEEAFSLSIATEESSSEIFYTLDGSDPSISITAVKYQGAFNINDRTGEGNVLSAINPNEMCYSQDVIEPPTDEEVDKGTIVRACVKTSEGKFSKTVTRSYFVGEKTASYGDIPIISVVTDKDNLFDYKKGIYTNGAIYDEFKKNHPEITDGWKVQTNSTQTGREWERNCHITLLESNNSVGLEQDCGMRVQGGGSRTGLQKSLRFIARSEYSKSSFEYPIIPSAKNYKGKTIKNYKSFIARCGGNDDKYLKFTDNYIQNMMNGRNITTQNGRGCIMFIDGEYWGTYILQEDYSAELFEEKYGVNKDDVVFVKSSGIEEGNITDLQKYYKDANFVINNKMIKEENYQKVCELFDIDSLIDYIAAELFICNADWPNNNLGVWRVNQTDNSNKYSDGKWRYAVYDTEYSSGMYGSQNTSAYYDNIKAFSYMQVSPTIISDMLWSLMKNDEFKGKFATAMITYANVNFNSVKANEVLKQQYDYYLPYLLQSATRFKITDKSNFNLRYNQLRYFYMLRSNCIRSFVNSSLKYKAIYYSVSVTANDVNGGEVFLNKSNISLKENNRFSGEFLTALPINLYAEPAEGYLFVGWQGQTVSTEKSFDFSINNKTNIKAIFIKENEVVSADADFNGKVDMTDIISLRKNLALQNTLINKYACDLNKDNIIDLKDVLLLRKKLANTFSGVY